MRQKRNRPINASGVTTTATGEAIPQVNISLPPPPHNYEAPAGAVLQK